jgi:2-keto-3-deoxy-6-phosphogluconate aldolase
MKKILLAIIVLVVVSIVCVKAYLSHYISQDMLATKKVMTVTAFSCQSSASIVIETWGPYGYARFCERGGLKNGNWEAWEKQKIAIVGHYADGMPSGKWTWFNKDGTVDKVHDYSRTSSLH